MAAGGIPVVLVKTGGTPVSPAQLGTPVTVVGGDVAVLEDGETVALEDGSGNSLGNGIVHIVDGVVTVDWPGGGAETPLEDGEPVNLDTHDGADILAVGTARVTAGNLVGILVPETTTLLEDAETVNIYGANGTSPRGTALAGVAANVLTLALPDDATIITTQASGLSIRDGDSQQASATAILASGSNQLAYISLDGTAVLAVDGAATKVANNIGAGPVDANYAVTGGHIVSVNISSAAIALVANTFSTDVTGYPAESFATCNVSSGGLQSVTVTLPATTKLITTGDSVEVENLAENQAVNGTALVNVNDTLTIKLPENAALVVNGSAVVVPVTGTYTTTITPAVDASGVITGFTLS